jgi:OmpA-OmpF porin, OOP family
MANKNPGLLVVVMLIAMTIALSSCATRQYVRHQVGRVEPQITEVRDAQTEQAERIDAVDRRAREGVATANYAGMAAMRANDAAIEAGRRAADADRLADAAQVNAQRAINRIDGVEREVETRIANLDKYALTDQTTVTFKFDSDELTTEAIAKLDDIAARVSDAKTRFMVELQGFTDIIGTEKYNYGLSERRADSVLRYLVSKSVPLYRISIVGLGKTNPIADNKTPGGREQNRRVEIRILRSSENVSTANR